MKSYGYDFEKLAKSNKYKYFKNVSDKEKIAE